MIDIEENKRITKREVGFIRKEWGDVNNNEQIRHKRVAPIIIKYTNKDKPILDIGCKIGSLYFNHLKEAGFKNYIGFDISEEAIEFLKERGGSGVVGDAQNLSEYNIKNIETVILLHCLEHCSNPKKVLEGIYSILNKGGLVYIEVPWVKKGPVGTSGGHFSFFHSFEELQKLYNSDKWEVIYRNDLFPEPPRCISVLLKRQ
jgi:ubiquinone/menaquinone biosynthesis C-methylase UbiE